jgi:hypothetical protein
MAAELIEPTKPQNAYWIWLSANRDALTKEAGSAKGPDVGKLAGTKWKAMAANAKAPFEKKAADLKATYLQAMEEFKAAGGVAGKRRQEKAEAKKGREAKKAKKEARKNSDKPTKPQTAYFLWINAEGRAAAQKELGTKNLGPVGKHCGEVWKTLSAAKKAPYEKEAAEKKAAYDKLFAEWKEKQGNKENEGDDEDDEGDEDEE